MKTKNLLKTTFLLVASGLILSSCQKNAIIQEKHEELQINAAVIEKLKSLYFNTDDVRITNYELPDGSIRQAYLVEGDLVITREQLEEMKIPNTDLVQERQFSTDNLVTNMNTIKIGGYLTDTPGYGLTPRMVTGLYYAWGNYVNADIGLDFEIETFSHNDFSQYDIVVYRVPNGQEGGLAGFPVNGNPNRWVRIYSAHDNDSYDLIEHIITHEIGHSIGLRHSDWFSRESCGSSRGESAGSIGANWIPGTPLTNDPNSVMQACFDGSEDGELGFYDKVALRFLYE